ncbi:hypothetical protein N7462_005430 [Penicillium macrosclerotiorum]|uniref:uncharacterized protein n=1 Tax=Penicillium macrosclerotiorum TaxID=303699 RepID=UPI0025471483|nr:uncharacterized protein N7462_005430 [Penicillium macrosclerotiorum]KAJ5682265.1 hypothetical protein N7462_005430 [Penicillium macrosclerotiorum]
MATTVQLPNQCPWFGNAVLYGRKNHMKVFLDATGKRVENIKQMRALKDDIKTCENHMSQQLLIKITQYLACAHQNNFEFKLCKIADLSQPGMDSTYWAFRLDLPGASKKVMRHLQLEFTDDGWDVQQEPFSDDYNTLKSPLYGFTHLGCYFSKIILIYFYGKEIFDPQSLSTGLKIYSNFDEFKNTDYFKILSEGERLKLQNLSKPRKLPESLKEQMKLGRVEEVRT